MENSIKNLIEKISFKRENWWIEIFNNGISSKWSARIAKYPSSNTQTNEDQEIFLEIGGSLEESLKKLLKSIESYDKTTK